jgi:hypothetical protein
VEGLLEQYAGKEDALFAALQKKYLGHLNGAHFGAGAQTEQRRRQAEAERESEQKQQVGGRRTGGLLTDSGH